MVSTASLKIEPPTLAELIYEAKRLAAPPPRDNQGINISQVGHECDRFI